MNLKRKLFNLISDIAIRFFGFNNPSNLAVKFIEKIEPHKNVSLNGTNISFYSPNELIYWRIISIQTKEPETIEWIDRFQTGETLFDIGANVGLYTIYAAKKGINVYSFEPHSQNFAIVNRNISLNGLDRTVSAFNLAFADKDDIDFLYVSDITSGSAMNNFGETKDWNKNTITDYFRQGILSMTIDSFLKRKPAWFPDHIKIDVDGIEDKIIAGAKNTISDKRLKSVLIEINEDLKEHVEIVRILKNSGLEVSQRRQSEIFQDSQYKSCFNYIFVRDKSNVRWK